MEGGSDENRRGKCGRANDRNEYEEIAGVKRATGREGSFYGDVSSHFRAHGLG